MCAETLGIPEVGQAVRVRGRLATVFSVAPYDGRQGRLHLVTVEYLDDSRHPESDEILWEIESSAEVLGATSLPRIDQHRPDSPSALQAFINTHRWTRLNRLRSGENLEDEPLLAVWNSAIQVHPYQLEPVLRALKMPRVSLLLCDGVGLGKTIEAGLVLQELLLRRRIRKVLILAPAMLQRQWRYELRRKFNLDFEIIDSESTFELRRHMGIDTNPWKVSPRIIASMDYLRIPDVLQQFLQASGVKDASLPGNGNGSAHASWDLLIVDECHNFAPQGGNRASLRTRMLREIRFLFEHRIFLSATPHNGYTVSFTGLLELLDPVRFQMKDKLEDQDRSLLEEVRVRRLKDEINRCSLRPPFADQLPPKQIDIRLTNQERDLYKMLRLYRDKSQVLLDTAASKSERNVSRFVFSQLTKRLLSCPFAFARTWWRHLLTDEAMEEPTLFDLAHAAVQKAESDIKSDDEKSQVEEDAVRHGGAWLRRRDPQLEGITDLVTKSLGAMRLDLKSMEALGDDLLHAQDEKLFSSLAKRCDSKTEKLVEWVRANLFTNGRLRDDERLIVFTEYKETLLYLQRRFLMEGFDEDTLRLLYGGMGAEEFESVQQQFEDPHTAVRLLLATDAASEGINMQECCRWVIHYDIPWSPTKILQRNGRVSRHGQMRDVHVHYFHSDQDEDLRFLFRVAKKVDQVRDDLGSVERVFDEAFTAHLLGKDPSDEELDRWIEQAQAASGERQDLGYDSRDTIEASNRRVHALLEASERQLGISPSALVDILRTAIEVEGEGALEDIPGRPGFYRLRAPARWDAVVRKTLTVGARSDRMELVFDSVLVEEEKEGRRVLRLKKQQALMRLSHPVMRQALATLSRELHQPTQDKGIYRWSIAALHKPNFEPVLIFHYYATAINELREPLHDEVFSAVFHVPGDKLSRVEKPFEDEVLHGDLLNIQSHSNLENWVRIVRGKWSRHQTSLERFMENRREELASELERRAKEALKREQVILRDSYAHRLKELNEHSRKEELEKLVKQRHRLEVEGKQLRLLPEMQEEIELSIRDTDQQIELQRLDFEDTRRRLEREQELRRELLAKRYTIRDLRVLPLAVQYVVPATAEDLRT